MKKIVILFVLFVSMLSAVTANACKNDGCNHDHGKEQAHSHDHDHSKCISHLTGDVNPMEIIPSGRTPDEDEYIRKTSEDVAATAKLLGYHVPPHQMIFASSKELVGMVPVGGYAVPHWLDGQNIVEGGTSNVGVMEFVVDGCPTCRSFYRDTTELKQQASIIMHVAGHNDFGKASFFQQSRKSDPVAAKHELAELMKELYREVDHDEVSLFYQLLSSLNGIQDYAYGSYKDPKLLKRKDRTFTNIIGQLSGENGNVEIESKKEYKDNKFPATPLAASLQALVENLPQGTPEWKYEMIRLFEKAHNLFPTVVQQKIANEGWAVFAQYQIPKYLKGYNDHEHIFEYSDLLSGVAGGKVNLTNPYWLGREAWLNIYRRFNEELAESGEEITELEKDQRFVQYAHTLMGGYTDADFLRVALDEEWVRSHHFYLKREASPEELQARGIQINPMEQARYEVTLSISSDRIIEAIIRGVAEKRRHFPRIMLEDINHKGQEVLYKHDDFEGMPLERFSAAQTLFVLSHIHEKPVALDTVASSAWLKGETLNDYIRKSINKDLQSEEKEFDPSTATDEEIIAHYRQQYMVQQDPDQVMRIRISVKPDGTVKVYEFPEDDLVAQLGGVENLKHAPLDEAWVNKELTEQLQAAVHYYKQDFLQSVNSDLSTKLESMMDDDFWKNWTETVGKDVLAKIESAASIKSNDGVVTHTHLASDAILEYRHMREKRIAEAIKNVLQGKAKSRTTASGVQLRALPMVPSFNHDRAIANRMMRDKKPAPIEGRYDKWEDLPIGIDDLSDLGQRPGTMPGDIVKIPPQEQGQGEGEGEGESDEQSEQPGEPSEQEPDDVQEGQGGNDPSIVEIPLEQWTEILNAQLELPNPRTTVGGMKTKMSVPKGKRTGEGSRVLWADTVIQAAKHVDRKELKRREGESSSDYRKRKKAARKKAMAVLPQEQYRVRARRDIKVPDHKAVVVFALDLSGSMQGEPIKKSKEFILNVTSFLESKYSQIEIRYVGYDTVAHELPREKIFNTALGGATDDTVGYQKVNEILDEYNPREYNMYVYGTADGGGFNTEEIIAEMEKVYARVQHMGFVDNQLGFTSNPTLLEKIRELSEKYDWFDYAVLDKGTGTVIQALHDFFGKGKNAKRGK